MKNKMKRTIAFAAALMMAASLIPAAPVSAKQKYKTKTEDGKEYIVFGTYEQDGDTSNGAEPIEWEVLTKNKKGILVVSRYVLDVQPVHANEEEMFTWNDCSLRKWLNDEFYNTAFSAKDKKSVKNTKVQNKDNSYYGTYGGKTTKDKVFCLSVDEVYNFFDFSHKEDTYGYCQDLIVMPTEYAKANGAFVGKEITEETYNSYYSTKAEYSEDCIGRAGCYWSLRSPGCNGYTTCRVTFEGAAGDGINAWGYEKFGVRPAMYLKK